MPDTPKSTRSTTRAKSAKAAKTADTKPALTDAVKVIRLLSALGRRTGLTAEDAVRVLEEAGLPTALRSAQRLLAGLADDPRFPIAVDKDERPFRYRWSEREPAWILPALSPEERAAMTAARLLAERRLPVHAKTFLSRTARAQGDFPLKVIEERFLPLPARVRTDVWSAVTASLQDGHYLKLRYRENRRTLEKTVLPTVLLLKEGLTILLAREQGESDTIAVPLHTVVTAFMTSFKPPVEQTIDLDRVTDRSGLNPGAGALARISFVTDKRDFIASLRETPLSPTQKILETNGTALVTFVEADSPLLRRWLAEKGDAVKALTLEPFEKARETGGTLLAD